MLQRFCLSAIAIIICSASSHAALVSEDFSYADNSALLGQSGGSGSWTGSWGASTTSGSNTGRIKADADANLSYSGGGYAISQTGTGRAFSDINAFRGINRYIDTNLTGTVWFTVLAQNLLSTDRNGIQFNNHADAPYTGLDYSNGNFNVHLSGSSLIVRYGGADSSSLATVALNQTHLLLGRITFQDSGVNDRLEVWANPTDLTNLGSPLFSNNTADIGADLYLAGVFGFGAASSTNVAQGYLDALRISDGGGNANNAFFQVTGVIVPEPGAIALLGLSALSVLVVLSKHRSKSVSP